MSEPNEVIHNRTQIHLGYAEREAKTEGAKPEPPIDWAERIVNELRRMPDERQITRMIEEYDKRPASLPSPAPQDAEQLARRFHETYERLAPHFGYRLREGFDVPWAEVPENNRKLMTAVCAEILAASPAQPVGSADKEQK